MHGQQNIKKCPMNIAPGYKLPHKYCVRLQFTVQNIRSEYNIMYKHCCWLKSTVKAWRQAKTYPIKLRQDPV